MRFFHVQKLLTVSAFLFSIAISSLVLPVRASAQVSDLANPDDANAFLLPIAGKAGLDAIKSMYDLYCSGTEFLESGNYECETHRQAYISSIINDLVFDTITLLIWGQTTGDTFTQDGKPPFSLSEYFSATESSAYQEMYAHGRIPNGYTTMIGATYAMIQKEAPVPTDMALFINDTASDTMFGTPAFAANPIEAGYRLLILDGWKVTRNLALSLLGLILAIVGLMIIFRSKIAPQVTVSIYNVLPTLPIAIALIVLSYPLISLALSAVLPLTLWANQLGAALIQNLIDENAAGVLNAQNGLAVAILAAMFAPYTIYFVAGGGAGTISMVFLVIALLLAVTIGSFVFLWNLAKIFMSFITVTLVAPLIMVMAILPGKQGLIMNTVKRVVVDIISLPVMFLGAYVAFALIIYTPEAANTAFLLPGFFGTIAGLGVAIPLIIKGFIGVGMLFKLGAIRKTLESNFGVSGLFGGGGDSKGPPRR